jgi:hypothetical protein
MAYKLGRSYKSITVVRSRLLRGLPPPKLNTQRRWTAAEIAVLNRDIPIVDMCRLTNRSYQSVVQKRWKLARAA